MKTFLKIKYFIILLSFLVLNNSCKRKRGNWSVTIVGQVTDYYTGKSLSNISLIVEECKTPLVTTTICKIKDTIITDQSGNYHYSLGGVYSEEPFDISNFQISVIPSENYANSEIRKVNDEKPNIFDFKIKPLKTLKISLSDTSHLYDELEIMVSESNKNGKNQLIQKQTINNPQMNNYMFFKAIPETSHDFMVSNYKKNEYKGYNIIQKYFENSDTILFEIKY